MCGEVGRFVGGWSNVKSVLVVKWCVGMWCVGMWCSEVKNGTMYPLLTFCDPL